MIGNRPRKVKCSLDPRRFLIVACLGLVVFYTFINLGNYRIQNDYVSEFLVDNVSFPTGRQMVLSTAQKNQLNKEKSAALSYLEGFDSASFTRPLSFFHIPKTAGTAIEHAAGSSTRKISWGSCVFNHGKRKRTDCEYPSGGKCK
jgi:hypothetical protein